MSCFVSLQDWHLRVLNRWLVSCDPLKWWENPITSREASESRIAQLATDAAGDWANGRAGGSATAEKEGTIVSFLLLCVIFLWQNGPVSKPHCGKAWLCGAGWSSTAPKWIWDSWEVWGDVFALEEQCCNWFVLSWSICEILFQPCWFQSYPSQSPFRWWVCPRKQSWTLWDCPWIQKRGPAAFLLQCHPVQALGKGFCWHCHRHRAGVGVHSVSSSPGHSSATFLSHKKLCCDSRHWWCGVDWK